MKYLNKSFSVYMEGSKEYEKNYDRIFRKKKIISNKAQCLICGEIIESKHKHDFKTCKCGNVSVDGGKEYLKRSIKYIDKYKDE